VAGLHLLQRTGSIDAIHAKHAKISSLEAKKPSDTQERGVEHASFPLWDVVKENGSKIHALVQPTSEPWCAPIRRNQDGRLDRRLLLKKSTIAN
jgi:hypothetical protein